MRKYIYAAVTALIVAASIQAQDVRPRQPTQAGYQFAVNRISFVGMRMNPVVRAQFYAEMQRREMLNQQRLQQQGYRYDPTKPNIPGIFW